MKQLTSDEILKLARSKNYEEFVVNKDLLGFHNKKFCQKHALEILSTMAAQHHDSKLACQIVDEAKHIQIGDVLYYSLFDAYYQSSWQPYIKANLFEIYKAVKAWYGPS